MEILQDSMHKALDKLPYLFLSKITKAKLAHQQIKLSKQQLHELVTSILNDKEGVASILLKHKGPARTVNVEFTDEDLAAITRYTDKFKDGLPNLVERVGDETAASLYATLKKRWSQEAKQQGRDLSEFQRRLYRRWGAGLNGLRMLLTIAREFGSSFIEGLRETDQHGAPVTLDVLIRLHARACQVADEVLCLLGEGFADGAIARWRTLHEIATVALFISDHGDELAERYMAHDIVETMRVVRQYEKYWQRLGVDAIKESELAEIKKRYAAAIAMYGPDFKGQYGWAAKHLNKPKPSIADIREGTKLDHLAPFYRFASHNVHANAKGILLRMGLIGESNILLSGRSNAGLAEPGHAAAQSLLQASAALLHLNSTLDNIVIMKIMDGLTDDIGKMLSAAHKQLEKDTVLAERRKLKPDHPNKRGRRMRAAATPAPPS